MKKHAQGDIVLEEDDGIVGPKAIIPTF